MTLKLPLVKQSMIVLSLMFFMSGCELLSEEINECINKVAPKLPPKNLVQGQVGVQYFESIQAEVKNANDDSFDYEFSLDSGSLPAGITYDWDGRLLKFSGTPTVAGTFKFKIKVRIPLSIYGPGDGVCFGKVYDRENYTITIMEAP